MEKQKFIQMVAPGAIKSQEKYGVYASVVIGQAIMESGWGEAPAAKKNNNLFGIKYPGKHDPSLVITKGGGSDDKINYAKYQSFSDSILDHGFFVRNNPRYGKAGAFDGKGPYAQLKALKAAGYDDAKADYAEYIMNQIIKPNKLEQYDSGTYVGGGAADSANNESTQQTIQIESTNYQVVKGSEKYGDYLFGRRHRIVIVDSQGGAIDVSDLHCVFNITKTMLMEANTSEIVIYNLNAKTENAISTGGSRITIEAGYEGTQQFGKIFDGDILQCIREKEDAHTYKLTIVALDSDRAVNVDISNFSIMRGQTLRSVAEHIVSEAKNPVKMGTIAESLSNTTLTRGKVIFGKSSDFLEQIAKSKGLQFYMDDGTVNLVDLKELPKDEIIELNPKSGLIGTPEQTDYGISGQCLLNPLIKLNSLIHVDNSLVRAKKIEFNNSSTVPEEEQGMPSGGGNSTIINVALKEEGYKETGDNNTKFGKWFGMNNQPWCAIFVCWCAHQAGIGTDIVLKSAAVQDFWDWYKGKGLFQKKGSYIPKAGDIFIIKGGKESHTGLVVSADNNCFYTIEGNYKDKVSKVTRYYSEEHNLQGFCTPNYPSSGDAVNADFSNSESGGGKTT